MDESCESCANEFARVIKEIADQRSSLLAALEAALFVMNGKPASFTAHMFEQRRMVAIEQAQAAIAKAKGDGVIT